MTTAIYARTLERLENQASLSFEDIARAIGSSPRTVYRWAKQEADPRARARDRLLEVSAVVGELSRVLRPESAHVWLFTPNPLLAFDRPIDLMRAGDYRRVLAAIEAVADGVFV
jgi:transcriptional regulator with XRE-family HTH domain